MALWPSMEFPLHCILKWTKAKAFHTTDRTHSKILKENYDTHLIQASVLWDYAEGEVFCTHS